MCAQDSPQTWTVSSKEWPVRPSRFPAEIKVVFDPVELRAVQRLRYEVYIEEQGKPYPEANHAERLLSDSLDHTAVVLGAFDGAACAGTVRFNRLDCRATAEQFAEQTSGCGFDAAAPAQVCITSRLAVAKAYRTSAAVCEALLGRVYEEGLKAGGEYCYLNCRPPIRVLMRRFGFEEVEPPFSHQLLGPLHRFKLKLRDEAALRAARSPILLRRYLDQSQSAAQHH
jgi:predicted GNAT family N-acyltransferase